MTITSTMFLGIDVSLDTNQVCAMNYNQDVFFNKSFKNTVTGSEELVNNILSVISVNVNYIFNKFSIFNLIKLVIVV
ncbi:MAG: IS110 family transposase [Erysipelotrichaceae bacterium]|nr:IS110 family transposase [Erysipelotrichaceae bacterium]